MSETTAILRYVALLQSHDWLYEWSDDRRVYERGRDQRRELERQQKQVDPDLALWNDHCHPDFVRKP